MAFINTTVNLTLIEATMNKTEDPNLLDCDNLLHPASPLASVYFQTAVYSMYVTIFIVALLGNVFVCYTVLSSPRMRTVTNYFIMNLAVGDMLITILCVPFTSVSLVKQYWPFGGFLCPVINYFQIGAVDRKTFEKIFNTEKHTLVNRLLDIFSIDNSASESTPDDSDRDPDFNPSELSSPGSASISNGMYEWLKSGILSESDWSDDGWIKNIVSETPKEDRDVNTFCEETPRSSKQTIIKKPLQSSVTHTQERNFTIGTIENTTKNSFETDPENSEISTSDRNKNKWNKRDFCLYCFENVTNFSRHLIRKHDNEAAVQQFLDMKVGSIERKNFLSLLRKKGNFLSPANKEIKLIRSSSSSGGWLAGYRDDDDAMLCRATSGVARTGARIGVPAGGGRSARRA
nr:unnamed protein product [Callosobruchus analis]